MKLYKNRPDARQLCEDNARNAMYPWSRTWPFDEDGSMVHLRLPKTLDLHQGQVPQRGCHGGPCSIANLPIELLNMILNYAGVVDRICLAISCKSLTAQTVASPHLKVSAWTPWYDYSVDISPSKNQLLRRLAHGWFNKRDFRYCCRCQRVLTRDPEYFRTRLVKRKKLGYDLKVDMDRPRWKALRRKKQYEHIIQTWCQAEYEDSSAFSCSPCRAQFASHGDHHGDLEKSIAMIGEVKWTLPVECPLCIEHSLTHIYKPPRKKVFRPLLLNVVKWVVSLIGNVLLVIIYLIYLSFKAPIWVTRWCWNKAKPWRASWKKPKMLARSWFKRSTPDTA